MSFILKAQLLMGCHSFARRSARSGFEPQKKSMGNFTTGPLLGKVTHFAGWFEPGPDGSYATKGAFHRMILIADSLVQNGNVYCANSQNVSLS